MLRTYSVTIALVAGLLAIGCAKRALVEVPPRVDLFAFGTIGIVEFASDAKGSLSSVVTQRFVETMQASQPGVRVLELGKLDGSIRGTGPVDITAIQAIGKKYGVGALVVGDLLVEDVRPKIDVYNMLTTMSVSADVDAALTTRLLETTSGATVWTRATRATRTVAQVGVGRGQARFDARDPKSAYGELVDALVCDVADDFRVSYVRQ